MKRSPGNRNPRNLRPSSDISEPDEYNKRIFLAESPHFEVWRGIADESISVRSLRDESLVRDEPQPDIRPLIRKLTNLDVPVVELMTNR